MDTAPVLELRDITKRFPGVVANDGVTFDLRPGEVHALLGENGAGKSTLMNILYGLYHPDEGEIRVHGEPVRMSSPREAIDRGIGMVHQHFMLIPVMTVAENIVLAVEPRTAGVFLDTSEAERRVREISEQFGLAVDPHARIQDISVGQQQRVEILKALYRGAEILVLDEPTAVLTPQEAQELFTIVRSLTAQGKSIIFISHKLNEVLDIADRITVLRRGKHIDTITAAGATEEGLARLMVGRDVLLRVAKGASTPSETLLRVADLHVVDDRGIEKVRGVSFDVRAGEIVAIAGVDGNGQTELIDGISGLRRVAHGSVEIAGEDVTGRSAHGHFDAGLGHVPEDRQRRGLVLDFKIAENVALHDYRSAPFSRRGWLYPKQMVAKARLLINEFDVRGGGPETPAVGLSGGNQQKVILAREIDRDPRVLIAAQPTRGLDVGAIEYVHRRLVTERDEGRAILLVSLELEEVLSLADRILVVYEGAIVGEFPPSVSEEELGVAMTGGGQEKRGVSEPETKLPVDRTPDSGDVAERYGALSRAGGVIAPVATAVLAFLIGGLVVLVTTGDVGKPLETYKAVFDGSGLNWFLPWNTCTNCLAATNLQQTLLYWTPLVLTGLAVAFAFRCGLFNIGGTGQYLMGSVAAVLVGGEIARLVDLPGVLLIILSVVAAMLAGGALAAIAGLLKATVGAHEVITTIMLNWIVIWVASYLFGVGGPLQTDVDPSFPLSNDVVEKAKLYVWWGDPILQGLHIGFFVALGSLVVYWVMLNRTTLGYGVRAVGFNPEAARYGGISVAWNYVLAMGVAGAFAGLAGALDILGWQSHVDTGDIKVSTIGFVGIAVALLGRNTAVGVGMAALLFAALQTGTSTRNLDPSVFPPELAGSLTLIIQGLIVLFVGADLIVLIVIRRLRRARPRSATT